jgi:cytochrome c2
MKNFLQIAFFTIAVSLMYTGVAQFLPQLENHPPAVVALGSKIGPEELVPIGQGAFEANCVQCHKMGESGRAPDLASMGSLAADRAAARAQETGKPYTDVDYLMESLCKPGDYVVEGFGNIMPPQGKALSGGQLLAVSAYLQSLGGEATIKGTDVEPVTRFGCVSGGGPGMVAAAEEAAPAAVGPPSTVYEKYGCSGCHLFEDDSRKIGPPMYGIGKRLNKGEIYEAILAPDAVIAKGDLPYGGGVMQKTLDGNGFYKQMTPADYQALVDWLAANKGEE